MLDISCLTCRGVVDVFPEAVGRNDLYVVFQSLDKASDAQETAHGHGKSPAAVVGLRQILLGIWEFFYEDCRRQPSHAQLYGLRIFRREHEYVGEHLLVAVGIAPPEVDELDALHARELERLALLGRQFVAAHLVVVVHQHEGLHYAVCLRVAVVRAIAAYLYHLLELYSLVDDRHVVGMLLPEAHVLYDVEVVESLQLLLYGAHLRRFVVGTLYDVSQEDSLVFGKVEHGEQLSEERRAPVDVIVSPALLETEVAETQEIEVIIQVSPRYVQAFAQLIHRVGPVFGKHENEVELALQFVVSHDDVFLKL